MTTMFGGKKDGESQLDYEKRLDEARTLFVGTISTFAQEMGDDLNALLTSGSISTLVSNFFEDLMDDMALSVNKATGGMLFSNRVDEIYAKQLIDGRIGAGQYNEHVGNYFEGGSAEELTNQMIGNNARQAMEDSGVSRNLSKLSGRKLISTDITAGTPELVEAFDDYAKFINALAGSLYDVDRDFEDDYFRLFDFGNDGQGRTIIKDGLDPGDVARAESMQRMMQERYVQAVRLNAETFTAYNNFAKIAAANNIKLENADEINRIGSGHYGTSVNWVIDNVTIDTDAIGTDDDSGAERFDLEQFMKAYRSGNFALSDFDAMLPIMQSNLNDAITNTLAYSPLTGFSGQEDGQDGAYVFNSIKGKNRSAFFETNSNADADVKLLNKKLLEYIEGGLTRKETVDLKTMMNTVEKRYGNLTEEDKDLLKEMRQLVERVSTLTNEISKTNKIDKGDTTSGG